jgi:hypothetical protein
VHAFSAATSNAFCQGKHETSPGPPPTAPSTCKPAIPTLAALNSAMILSEDSDLSRKLHLERRVDSVE